MSELHSRRKFATLPKTSKIRKPIGFLCKLRKYRELRNICMYLTANLLGSQQLKYAGAWSEIKPSVHDNQAIRQTRDTLSYWRGMSFHQHAVTRLIIKPFKI